MSQHVMGISSKEARHGLGPCIHKIPNAMAPKHPLELLNRGITTDCTIRMRKAVGGGLNDRTAKGERCSWTHMGKG